MGKWVKLHEITEPIGYRSIVFKTFRAPDGKEYEFSTYGKRGIADVAVVAITPHNTVIIAKQFRQGPEKTMHELPGGAIEQDESLGEAAARELLEETGYQADRLDYVGYTIRDAYSNGTSHYFIGYDCVWVQEQVLDEAEHIDVVEIAIDELIAHAKQGTMTDAGGVLLAYDKLCDIQGRKHE